MDGNNMKECEILREKSEQYASCIRTGFISRDDAVVALHSTIMKSLEYPMTAVTLTKKEWDYIMAPLLQVALPKMGYVRSFPCDIVYAPKALLCIGTMHPWVNQELAHIETCLQEGTAAMINGADQKAMGSVLGSLGPSQRRPLEDNDSSKATKNGGAGCSHPR